MHNQYKVPQDVTPTDALEILKKGNFRFVNNLKVNRDLLEQVNETKDGQWPFATILSCMDSRTSAELIFDQGLGDIFSIRIAGNVVTDNILGCLEFATELAGSKLIVVLGHTNCGAIKGACDNVKLGNLTTLLEKIRPAVVLEETFKTERNSRNKEYVDAVAKVNVKRAVQQIQDNSSIISALIERGEVGIIPAMYDIATGQVSFFDDEAIINSEDPSKISNVA